MKKLTPQEQYKLDIVTRARNKQIKSTYAAKLLGISTRQLRRLKRDVHKQGKRAVIHKLKGRASNAKLPETTKTTVLKTIKKTYLDFKPGFATEKLAEQHGISISPETTRLWMMEEGLWKSRKQKQTVYRAWRPRKEYFGELQQFDGSYHYWFEQRFVDGDGNPIEVCLLASIDDATGTITKAAFAANEGVVAVFTFWQEYVKEHGKPGGVYLDKYSTYKINHKSAVDNFELLTQFQRAARELTLLLITAHSAQAKGRIERLFQTLQDRLVKEMRLANINTPEAGNKFLTDLFIPKFNKQFGVTAAKEGNVHTALTKEEKQKITSIFSIKSYRTINHDFTIQFKNTWYQLAEIQPTTIRPREKVIVEEWLDGTIHLSVRGQYLAYILLPARPKRTKKTPPILTTHQLNWKPAKDHPWRQYKKKVIS